MAYTAVIAARQLADRQLSVLKEVAKKKAAAKAVSVQKKPQRPMSLEKGLKKA